MPSQTPLKIWLQRLRYQLFWQGLWLPYFKNFKRHEFTFHQHLNLVGLIGLARSQGFTPSGGAALDKLVVELSQFHHHFCDTQGQVCLTYRTHLYLATSTNYDSYSKTKDSRRVA